MKYILISDPDISFKDIKDEHFDFIYFRESQWEISSLNGESDFFEYEDLVSSGVITVGYWNIFPNNNFFKKIYKNYIVKGNLLYVYIGEKTFTGEDLKRRLI